MDAKATIGHLLASTLLPMVNKTPPFARKDPSLCTTSTKKQNHPRRFHHSATPAHFYSFHQKHWGLLTISFQFQPRKTLIYSNPSATGGGGDNNSVPFVKFGANKQSLPAFFFSMVLSQQLRSDRLHQTGPDVSRFSICGESSAQVNWNQF